jgi:hypothetical protein
VTTTGMHWYAKHNTLCVTNTRIRIQIHTIQKVSYITTTGICRYTIQKDLYVTATLTHTYVYTQTVLYMTATVYEFTCVQCRSFYTYMTATGIRKCRRQKALYVTTNGVGMHMFWSREVFISDSCRYTRVYSEEWFTRNNYSYKTRVTTP